MGTTTVTPRTPAPQADSLATQIRKAVTGNFRQYGMMIALGLLVLLFEVLTNGLFLAPRNVTSLLVQNGYILILAIGMVMVIIAGHIDLSVGSVCALVGAVAALSMKAWALPWPMAILVGLAVGILVGIWQGYWVAYVGIPAFIVTLAGMLLFRGLQLIILNAESITVPDAFQKIANGYLPEIGQNMPYHLPTLLLTVLAIAVLAWLEFAKRRDLVKYGMTPPSIALSVIKLVVIGAIIAGVGMLLASYKGIPIVGLILLGLVIIYSFVTQRTVIGRHIYAVGGNSNAARLSGVDTRKVDFFVMVNMAFLAAIAGMVFTAYLNAANPKDGVGFELDAIAAVFIGGAAVAGGVGTVTGSMIGGLVMGVLNLGLANLSVDSNTIQVIKGLVLLGAVAFDVLSKSRGKPSFIGMIMSAFGSKPDPTPVRANEVSPATGVTNVAASHADSVPEGMTSEGSVTDEPSSGVGRE